MEEVDQPVEGTTPETPDLNDDVISRLEKAFDTRFSGLQGILDKNIGKLRSEFASQIEEVRRSSMSPEELEDLEISEKERELARLKKENELLKMRKDHPDEVDFLSSFLSAESFEEQLKLLKEFRSNRADGPTPREEPDEGEGDEVPVDKNNPANTRGGDSLSALVRNAGSLTREQAMKLLEATNEKGILARLRRE
jgi:hypothetical protein